MQQCKKAAACAGWGWEDEKKEERELSGVGQRLAALSPSITSKLLSLSSSSSSPSCSLSPLVTINPPSLSSHTCLCRYFLFLIRSRSFPPFLLYMCVCVACIVHGTSLPLRPSQAQLMTTGELINAQEWRSSANPFVARNIGMYASTYEAYGASRTTCSCQCKCDDNFEYETLQTCRQTGGDTSSRQVMVQA